MITRVRRGARASVFPRDGSQTRKLAIDNEEPVAMRRIGRTMLALVILANCSGNDTKVANIDKAADAFVAVAGDFAHTGRVPRQTDPEVKKLLDVVFDTTGLQNDPAQPLEIGAVRVWLLAVNKVGRVYTLAGTGASTASALHVDAVALDRLGRNMVEFAPEMGRYIDADLRLQAAFADSVAADMATAPASVDRAHREGLTTYRAGATRALIGALQTLANEDLTVSWRLERAPVLLASAPKVARTLAAEDIATLRATAQDFANRQNDADLKFAFAAFSASLTHP
jgi:hypothetical protein